MNEAKGVPPRRKVALLGFFPAFDPPTSGGEMRAYHTWRALAERYDVTAVTPTHPGVAPETVRHTATLVEHRVPKSDGHVRWHRRLGRLGPLGSFPECSAFVVGLAGRRDTAYTECARAAIAEADVIVFEGPFFPHLAARPDQFVVYSSYNVEYRLQAQTWGGPMGRAAARLVRHWERRLVERADAIFACSEEDSAHFVGDLGARPECVFVAPNGTEMEQLPAPADDEAERRAALGRLVGVPAPEQAARPRVVFLGSRFPTNLEAARLIERTLAPAVPEADFYLAGSCCDALAAEDGALGAAPANVRRLGFLDQGTAKSDFLHMAHLALNPVLSGSGTSVKNLDFLGAGLPLLATPMGARGMRAFASGGAGLFVEPVERLAERLRLLLGDPAMLASAGRAARQVVEREFQWSTIGPAMVEAIEHRRAPRKVLVAVDYPIDPPDHGGKVRVFQQAQTLAREGFPVTILSLNKEGRHGSRLLAPGIVETTVARTAAHNDFDRSLAEATNGRLAFDDITCLLQPSLLASLRSAAERLAGTHQAAILSHPYLAALLPALRRTGFVVHDAHNAEFEMKRQLLEGLAAEGVPLAEATQTRMLEAVARGESDAVAEADLVLATSQEDRATLLRLLPDGATSDRVVVAPNGVDCGKVRPATPTRCLELRRRAGLPAQLPVALFVGSAHPPNVEAARFIAGTLAPAMPDMLFLLIGTVAHALAPSPSLPPNLRLIGPVEEALKGDLLALADIALNPVVSGSGTNLKTVEYMAAGLALLSTPVGARGTGARHGEQALILERAWWPAALRALLDEPEHAAHLGRAARRLAEERFDWPVAMWPLVEALRRRLGDSAAGGEPHDPAATGKPADADSLAMAG